MKRILLAVILLLVIVGAAFAQQRDPSSIKKVTAKGLGTIIGGDKSRGRDVALQDAKRQAIEQGAGVYVQSETEVKNYEEMKDRFLTRSQGFIGQYRVISEGVDGKDYFVEIEAEVYLDAILEGLADLDILQSRKMMIFIPEITHETPDWWYYWNDTTRTETQLMGNLVANLFQVIDRQQFEAIKDRDELKQAIEGNIGAAALLGKEFGADVFLLGKARASKNTEMAGMVTYDAALELKAVNTETGSVIWAGNFNATSRPFGSANLAANDVFMKLGDQAGKVVKVVLPQKWGKEFTGGSVIRITIGGAKLSQVTQIKGFLSELRGFVKNSAGTFTKGTAIFELTIKDTADNVAAALEEATFQGFRVEITGFSTGSIDLKVT